MKRHFKEIFLIACLLFLNVDVTLNAQIVRFIVNVDKSQVSEQEVSINDDTGKLRTTTADVDRKSRDRSSGCLIMASRENVMVLVRTSMNPEETDSMLTVESRYINNEGGCPDTPNQQYEVSSPFKDGQATFHLNQLQTPKRSIPGIRKEIVSYLTILGYRTPGKWMKAGSIKKSEGETGIEFTVEIEYL